MKKKPIYIFLLTLVFIAPVLYWLRSRWGVALAPGQMAKIALAYSRDRFLLFSSIMNVALYIFCLVKIAQSQDEAPSPAAAVPSTPTPSFIATTKSGQINPNDEKWKSAYSGNPKPRAAPVPQTQQSATAATATPANGNAAHEDAAPAFEAPAADAATGQPAPPAEPNAEVISIANKITRDVFIGRINDEMAENGYEAMGSAVIDGVNIDFVGIAESDTLVLGILNERAGDIIANETSTSPASAPSWFTSEQKYDSPVWEARNAAAAAGAMIREVLPDDSGISVVPAVVIPNAAVVNMADMEKKWEEAGVIVARFMNYSDLPDFVSSLPDKRGTEVLPSYRKFVETLLKYFAQKAKSAPMRKTG
ncbi:MAG: hypothetical protein LBI17_00450 [Rickettsiales bacterium]|jgi:hypothetical protein|nr:hypothetical protein [Rickettsiales bacterium]